MAPILALLGWLSAFVLAWTILAGAITPTPVVWGFWFFFLLVGIAASREIPPKPPKGTA